VSWVYINIQGRWTDLTIVSPLVADKEGGGNGAAVGVPPLTGEQVLVQPAGQKNSAIEENGRGALVNFVLTILR
jgi:hypothetical protein